MFITILHNSNDVMKAIQRGSRKYLVGTPPPSLSDVISACMYPFVITNHPRIVTNMCLKSAIDVESLVDHTFSS